MSLLLLAEYLALADAGNIASGEAIGEPTLTQQAPQVHGGSVVWPWWMYLKPQQQQQQKLREVQVEKPDEPELHRVLRAGSIPSEEAIGVPLLTLAMADAGSIPSEEEVGEPTIRVRRLRLVRQAEEMALLIWRKAA